MPTRYVAETIITSVQERKRILRGKVGSVNPHTGEMVSGSLEYESDGWWITTAGPSPMAMKVGDRAPEGVRVGMPAKIVLEV
jgi:hypothetical protein